MASFKYLEATLCKNGTCSAEIWIRIASAMAAMARQNRNWRCNTISFASKFKPYKFLVTSILLYAMKHGPCLLTLKKERIQTFETKCIRKLLRISYLEHKTNDWVRSKISLIMGPQEPLLATVKRQKLAWLVWSHHTPQQLLQNHPSGHLGLGRWVMPRSAEEMLDGQHRIVDIPARARTAHNGPLQKRVNEDLC